MSFTFVKIIKPIIIPVRVDSADQPVEISLVLFENLTLFIFTGALGLQLLHLFLFNQNEFNNISLLRFLITFYPSFHREIRQTRNKNNA